MTGTSKPRASAPAGQPGPIHKLKNRTPCNWGLGQVFHLQSNLWHPSAHGEKEQAGEDQADPR